MRKTSPFVYETVTVPPSEETVLTPEFEVTVVELVPPGVDVDVEELPGTDVDEVEGLELVEELRLVVEDDEAVSAVEVVALITGAPGASLT